ncbi:heterokaryon incompatibility protein-domain-containing protein, partial [Phaeosphaeriaceae sp. PMI808]
PLKNPESSIRLLSITSIDDGNVSVSLRETPNLNAEPYHCLSYTWGPSEPQLQITCDGRIFQSRQNLYDALVHLQRVQPEKMTAIWIDAICIDQQNDTEKGFQLKRMHAIYAGAQSVIIWLG